MKFQINNTFTDALPSDPIVENTRRQVHHACYSYVEPSKTKAPLLVHHFKEVADLLGISEEEAQSEEFLQVFTGNALIPESKPYAMCYGGHQFGQWAGQLGDGRAINLAEIEHQNKRWALQLKGSGATPYSRTADGLAVLRSSIREYLCSEAMFHLGVPTTRALSLSLSGEEVLRDMFYNGNAAYEKGAIVCRVAPSFLRFGSYELFASRGEIAPLKTLVDYTIQQFYPQLSCDKEGYINLLKEVGAKTMDMVLHWQRVGFVHGVMNTDNLSILGLTIDYGPYGWLEGYEKGWTPNTTDAQNKRYQFGDQAQITLWNLVKLANALYPLIEEAEPLEAILNDYQEQYFDRYIEMMNAKLGLEKNLETDFALIQQLETLLELTETDMTIFFRRLSEVSKNQNIEDDHTGAFLEPWKAAFYKPEELKEEIRTAWKDWFGMYLNRLQEENLPDAQRKEKMDAVNPKYVLRNYMAQLAIEAADKGDYTIIEELATLLKKPYDTQENAEKWFAKRPEWARVKPGCSMLSCSS